MVYEMERTHVDSVYPFDVLVTKDEGVSPRKKHLDVCMSVDVLRVKSTDAPYIVSCR
jgi:hypothetical protein